MTSTVTVNSRISGTTHEPDTLTVGQGQRFATIADAIAYINTQTRYDVITNTGITCSTVLDDCRVVHSALADVEAGDLLVVTNDPLDLLSAEVGIDTEHHYPILRVSPELGVRNIYLPCGILGASQSNIPLVIYRPRHFVISCVDAVSYLTDSVDIPEDVNITITANGGTIASDGDTVGFLLPKSGFVFFRDIKAECLLYKGSGTTFTFPNTYGGLAFLTVSDIHWIGRSSQIGANFSGSGVVAKNLQLNPVGEHGIIFYGDYVVVQNVTAENTALEETLYFYANDFTLSNNYVKIIDGIISRRGGISDNATGAGIKFGYGAAVGTYEVSNLYCEDSVNDATCPAITTNNAIVNIRNSTISNTGAAYLANIKLAGTSDVVTLRNTKRPDNTEVTASLAAGSRLVRYDSDAKQSIAYAAAITPDCDSGLNIQVGTLTGNITINAPTHAVAGMTMTLGYTSDGSARTITYNAVFKSSVVPASTANLKATHVFKFDGTHWVQVGGALLWL